MQKLFFIALTFLLSTIACTAQTSDENSTCLATDPDRSPDISISACTISIQSNELQGKGLAAAYVQRGIAYRAVGKYDESEVDILAALEITEHKAPILRMLAWTYRQQDRLSEAENFYTRVLEVDQHWQGWLSRCVVRTDLRRYQEAIRDCDQAFSQAQEDMVKSPSIKSDISYFKSLSLIELKRYDEAFTVVSDALTPSDISGRLYFLALVALWNSERYDEVHDLLEDATALYPDDPEILFFMEQAGFR